VLVDLVGHVSVSRVAEALAPVNLKLEVALAPNLNLEQN
jgi:hypothetical protein